MDNKFNFNSLNDEQSTYITLISYIDINDAGIKILENGGAINVSELYLYLENPDCPYFGKLLFADKGLSKLDSFRGKHSPLSITDAEMVAHMIEIGLGNIQITANRNECGLFSSGFKAFALKDSFGNVGISYCGSNVDATKGALREWLEANVLEYFRGTSAQVQQAQDFFDKYKHLDGKTYVYGASLGGNLSQHIYKQNYNEIARVFTVNGNPINQKALDTPEKIAAFNNPEKASFNVIGGDIVGLLKNCDLYPDTVHYIKNNGKLRDLGGLESHLLEAATYDENHNFVTITREEALDLLTPTLDKFTEFTRYTRDKLNEIGSKHSAKAKNGSDKVKK